MTEVVTKQRPTDQSQISAAGLFQRNEKEKQCQPIRFHDESELRQEFKHFQPRMPFTDWF